MISDDSFDWFVALVAERRRLPIRDANKERILSRNALAFLGLRHPLQMLPLLLFELAWKTIFVLAVALPLWRAGAIDPATRETALESLFGVILVPITGAVLGALVYVTTSLQPALHALVQGLGGGGLRYAVTLERILRTCRPPSHSGSAAVPTPEPDAGPPAVRVAGLTFRYGPRARPILDDFSTRLGIAATPDQICVGGGAKQILFLALMATVEDRPAAAPCTNRRVDGPMGERMHLMPLHRPSQRCT